VSAEGDGKSQELSFQIRDLKESLSLKDTMIKSLENTVEAVNAEIAKLREYANGSGPLAAEVKQLKMKIKEKDQRIKKLEAVKLTKEFAEEHKQLKKNNKALQGQLHELQLQFSSASDSALRTELSELRFDKEALESKLRKFAAHCQRLEDDKAGMALALRSCNIDTNEYDGDMNEAVIALCDKLTSLQEVESVRSRRNSGGNDRLESENVVLQAKLDRLVVSEEKLNERISRYQHEIDELRNRLKDVTENNSESVGENGEMSRKLRYLEQENLQLMFDVKTSKKQLQAAREEIEILRMNAMDNSTLDFGTVDFGSDSSQISKAMQPGKPSSKATSEPLTKAPLVDKTNKGAKHIDTRSTKQQLGKLPAATATDKLRPKAPGLGEAAIQGDETGECTQS